MPIMLKLSIDRDEWYPVYSLEKPSRYTNGVKVSVEDYQDYLRVMAEFKEWQDRLGQLWLDSEPPKPMKRVEIPSAAGVFTCHHEWYYAEQDTLKCLKCKRWRSEFPDSEEVVSPAPQWKWVEA